MSWAQTLQTQSAARGLAANTCDREAWQARNDLQAQPQRERAAQIARIKALTLNTNTKPASAQPAAKGDRR